MLSWFLDLAGVSDRYYFFIFIFIIIVIGVLSRNMELDKAFLLYTASLVAFSSAIANQYLIIPMIALATYKNKAFYWIYTAIGSFYCILNQNELVLELTHQKVNSSFLYPPLNTLKLHIDFCNFHLVT